MAKMISEGVLKLNNFFMFFLRTKINLNEGLISRVAKNHWVNFKQISHFKKQAGFTLIEVIAVLLILSIGLLGILSLIIQNIQSQSINKSTLIAYQLAQEGAELIRKTRDTQWNLGVDWDTYFPEVSTARNYYMSYLDTHPSLASPADLTRLYQDDEGFYSHDPSGDFSGFSRTINLTRLSEGSLFVRVTIAWQEYNRNMSYVLETMLYDWR